MDESSPQEMDKICTENNFLTRQSVDTATTDDELPNFKTPVHCKSSNVWTENVLDSGFSSAHPLHLSDRSSSASSSVRSSPEQRKLSGGRRVTLGACHFSPVTRESFSVIRSRKLVFNKSPDVSEYSTKHYHFDEDVKSQERLSEDAELKEKKRDHQGTGADATLFSPISPGLFSLEKYLSISSARLSPEDLETSLQDMSLEESASSSSSLYTSSHSRSISPSPLIKSCISQHEDSEAESAMSCSSSSEAVHEQKNQDAVETVCNVSSPLPTPVEHVTSSDSTVLPRSSCKEHFMTALHLTSAQVNNNNVITTSLACATNPSHCSQSKQHISQALHNQVANFSPGNTLALEKSITVTHHLLTCPQNDQADFQLVKSPYKRSGTSKTDIEYLFSPTKSRKTDNSQQLSPTKHATQNIFQERRETAGHIPLVKFDRLPEFVTFHSLDSSNLKTELTSSTNISTRGPNPTCIDSDKTIKDYHKSLLSSHSLPSCFQKVVQNLSPAEPSRLIGRNIGVTTLDIIGSLYPHFSLCIARIMSNLDNEDLLHVFMVSKAWRQALEDDRVSFHRFMCYQSDMANKRKSQAYQGKENESEKYIHELKAIPMTESKGCLTSLQLQADMKPPPPLQEKPKEAPEVKTGVMWGDQLRHCPSCQHPALVRPHEGRAICMDSSCGYDFCTLCFSAFHHPKPCKPLNRSVSKKDVAGTHKSRKSLKRL